MLAMALVIGAFVGTAFSGPAYRENTVVVPTNATSASVTVEFTGMGTSFGTIDRVIAVNSSGLGTGTVSFALYDLGGKRQTISTSTNLASGSTWYDCPKYGYVGYGVTNIVDYTARQVIVTVSQPAVTNVTRYLFGIYAK